MSKLRRFIGVLLILIGVSIMGIVVYRKIITSNKKNQMVEVFENQLKENINDNNENEEIENLDSINGYVPIAIIEIPSIKLKQPVVEGITEDVIKYFLGKFPNSAMPGEVGNFAVAGHRVSDFTDAFINLYKVKSGDEVIVKTKSGKYIYEVEESFIVNPEQVEVLDTADYEKITMITCTVGSKRRVIVTGRLINKSQS